ncbi:Epoxyqueuosine reductase [hydrothermal vent metagenome]|uniref:Epoxyqueuosine reductase n=1 Tax=hydrothermal vent metagenome TaxID=652676 RepID=A0A3B0TBA3_9ZZZZ
MIKSRAANPANEQKLLNELQVRAEKLGFDVFGIVEANARPDLAEKLDRALKNNWHAAMNWMANSAERRQAPKKLWDGVNSIIMVGLSYAPERNPLADLKQKSHGNISVYARNRDYHDLIKGRLKEIAGLLARRTGEQVKVFVDTAPVMEKPLAASAGLGWQGKNSVLTSKKFGSWLFLGAIYTSAALTANEPHQDNCGTCTRCLDICPTNAFAGPYQLDARKCLAYYNNEHYGAIPVRFRGAMGNRIFGCDDCLAICPWNKFAAQTREAKLSARADLELPSLGTLCDMDENQFRQTFTASPVKRLGHARFLRNVLIALGNSCNGDLLGHAEARLGDERAIVRGAAIWAVRQLADQERVSLLADRYGRNETDPEVADEWIGNGQ